MSNVQKQGYVAPAYVPPVEGTPQPAVERTSITDFGKQMLDYGELDRKIKELKAEQDKIKVDVVAGLKELKMSSVKTEYGTFTIVPESRGVRFDSARLKLESPRIYELYLSPSVTSEYLKVTPKKKKA